MYPDLKGKKALITGASKGIGAAIARRLSAEGCDTIICARNEKGLRELKTEIEAQTGTVCLVAATDLSVAGSAATVARDFPEIDILVNNAGEDPAGSLEEIDEDTWTHAWALKGFGYINMCRQYYPLMRARGGGVIINIIGIAHFFKEPRYIFGAANTAALNVFTQTLGGGSQKDNIRVLAVNPGVTATTRLLKGKRLTEELLNPTNDTAQQGDKVEDDDLVALADQVAHSLGRSRSAQPAEIAAVVAFAVSDQASYITGISLNVDGGISRT